MMQENININVSDGLLNYIEPAQPTGASRPRGLNRRSFVKLGLASSVLFSSSRTLARERTEKLRFSTWYWLNSIQREKWDSDFQSVAASGFSHVILCWGLDAAAVLSQYQNTRHALDLCGKHGLKAYLFIWHPRHNSLPRRPEFQQVDNRDNTLFTFNLFHAGWRATQWKDYLQRVARAYKDHPAFAGYLFDDTFSIGPVGYFGGEPGKKLGDFVSYSAHDMTEFRRWLRKKYGSLREVEQAWQVTFSSWESIQAPREITSENTVAWNDWCRARLQWLREWAGDTVNFIRAVDKSHDHAICLEDGVYILGKQRTTEASIRPVTMRDTLGMDFEFVAGPFDEFCAYAAYHWDVPNALDTNRASVAGTIQAVSAKGTDRSKVICAFWVADRSSRLDLPTASQILSLAEAAIRLGVRHVNYYAFRVGDARVTRQDWPTARPGAEFEYPITKALPGRYLCDKPDLLRELADGHRRLDEQYR